MSSALREACIEVSVDGFKCRLYEDRVDCGSERSSTLFELLIRSKSFCIPCAVVDEKSGIVYGVALTIGSDVNVGSVLGFFNDETRKIVRDILDRYTMVRVDKNGDRIDIEIPFKMNILSYKPKPNYVKVGEAYLSEPDFDRWIGEAIHFPSTRKIFEEPSLVMKGFKLTGFVFPDRFIESSYGRVAEFSERDFMIFYNEDAFNYYVMAKIMEGNDPSTALDLAVQRVLEELAKALIFMAKKSGYIEVLRKVRKLNPMILAKELFNAFKSDEKLADVLCDALLNTFYDSDLPHALDIASLIGRIRALDKTFSVVDALETEKEICLEMRTMLPKEKVEELCKDLKIYVKSYANGKVVVCGAR